MKPIETIYKGYRFRSRLEARWAVFYDALEIPYRYEVQGFDLDGKLYLPDFWLPDQSCWVEIKGQHPTEDEAKKAELLCMATKQSVFIFSGDCWIPSWETVGNSDGWAVAYGYAASPENGEPIIWGDEHYCWCECWQCGKLGIQFDGRSGRICRHDDYDKHYNQDSPRLQLAYTAARQARFEHGESGEGHA